MRCLLSGNDFCGSPERMGCRARLGAWLILSTHNILECKSTGVGEGME